MIDESENFIFEKKQLLFVFFNRGKVWEKARANSGRIKKARIKKKKKKIDLPCH